MKEDGWSKSIIAVAHRRQHQAYQHRSASVMAAASHSGMCTRHYLSSGSILRHFVQRGQWLCQRAVIFVATEFCLWSFSLFFLYCFGNVSHYGCFVFPSACVSSNDSQQNKSERRCIRDNSFYTHANLHSRITLLKTETALKHCTVHQINPNTVGNISLTNWTTHQWDITIVHCLDICIHMVYTCSTLKKKLNDDT